MLAHPTPTTNATVMSDAGGANGIVGGNLVLDDEAANQLPDTTAISSGSCGGQLAGRIKNAFPAPAPAQSANVNLSTFDGMAANGTWTLWVQDDLGGDQGQLHVTELVAEHHDFWRPSASTTTSATSAATASTATG